MKCRQTSFSEYKFIYGKYGLVSRFIIYINAVIKILKMHDKNAM